MSLSDAVLLSGRRPALPPGPPYACAHLGEWGGREFEMPAGDPRLVDIHAGGPAPTPPMDNLVGAVRYWDEHADWMELLDPNSPSHHDKMIERALYLDLWEAHIPEGARVLDLGGGVGRFTAWLLERGCSVELVDPDLRSLWRAVRTAAEIGRGSIDVHWTTGERLPDLAPVDVVIASEVLCYVEDPERALAEVARVLRPGGKLLVSVESRWGWAMVTDVHEGTLDAWLDDGVLHVPGDRWVRTFTEDAFRDLLEPFDVEVLQASHYALSGPFEMAAGPLEIDEALVYEQRLRAHPIAGPLNRAWMAVASRP